MWAPDGPAKFYLLDALPYRVAVFGRQPQNPFADRIAAIRADIEPCGKLFCAVNHPVRTMCHFWHIVARHFAKAPREAWSLLRPPLPAQLRPIIQPFSDFARKAAIGGIVKGLAAQRFRKVILA